MDEDNIFVDADLGMEVNEVLKETTDSFPSVFLETVVTVTKYKYSIML